MEPITSVDKLRNNIHILEFDHALKGQLLREQIYLTVESLKPVNLIKSTIHEITASPYLIENILGAVAGLITGYISKSIATGKSRNIFRNLLGAILQFGVTNVVARRFIKKR
jgi:hypothetical protein